MIRIEEIVTAMEQDHEPYYYIKFITTYGSKFEWEYTSKELRDKELKEIREHRKKTDWK